MSDETKTIRVHRYAECDALEAAESHRCHGYYLAVRKELVELCHANYQWKDAVPVRHLGAIEMPAPPKPRERIVYRFEEVDTPEADEEGRWWYAISGIPCWYGGKQDSMNAPLRRTVERIAVEPERWAGCAKVDGSRMSCRGVAQVGFLGIFAGENRPTREQAEADLPLLRNLAEQYAAAHGATIEWRDSHE